MGDSERWLIVGLGNPGARYAATRHNIGFMAVDALADELSLRWRQSSRFNADLCTGSLRDTPVVLLKPLTYMNLSGNSVGSVAHYYRIGVDQIIVAHDDVDLDLGRLKLKRGGGDGGHKGIRSMAQHLSSPEFVRIRLGVGRPQVGEVTDYVLGPFRQDEEDDASRAIEQAVRATRITMTRGLTEAMNRYNRPPPA